MRLQFWFDKVRPSSGLQAKIAKKFASLDKYIAHVSADLREAVVSIGKGERWGYKVKINLTLPGKRVIAESKDKTLLNAVDQVENKTRRELKRYVAKLRGRD